MSDDYAIQPLPPGLGRAMIVVTTLMMSLMAAVDLTIVTVALPYMSGSLGATADDITWVVTMYTVAQAVAVGISGHLSRLLRSLERQARLLQREAVDVAVQDCVGVGGQRDREARTSEAPEDGVVVAQRRRTR